MVDYDLYTNDLIEHGNDYINNHMLKYINIDEKSEDGFLYKVIAELIDDDEFYNELLKTDTFSDCMNKVIAFTQFINDDKIMLNYKNMILLLLKDENIDEGDLQ